MNAKHVIRAIVVVTRVHRFARRTARVALSLAILAAGVAIGLALSGPAFNWTMSHPASVTPSGLCAIPAVPGYQVASVLIPGDAGRLWLPGAGALHEYVCTDGTLVPVEDYGVRPAPVQR